MDKAGDETPHKRRPRYRGTHPRSFSEKYKELNPELYPEDIQRVIARGDTPAGSHRSICLTEVLEILKPQAGEIAVDATLGYGGHSREILKAIRPGGHLYGFDQDPLELPKTQARLLSEGFGPDIFSPVQANFSRIRQSLDSLNINAVDMILADLGVSSMQIDDPQRGFSFKDSGPLDMRMNTSRGETAALLLRRLSEAKIAALLEENGDEPYAAAIAHAIVADRKGMTSTAALSLAIKTALCALRLGEEEILKSTRRSFQALRIAVNAEYEALDSLLLALPACLKPGGRVAILSFHSGEDMRVVSAFEKGLAAGEYSAIHDSEIRASSQERYSNPRSRSARLRWAIRA